MCNQIFHFFRKFDKRLYKSRVKTEMHVVLMRLNKSTASQNAENASATVIPKILPPNKYAYTGNIKNRLARSAVPVASKLPIASVISTVFIFFL